MREGTKVGRTAGAWGDLTRRTTLARELAIYLRTLLHASFHHSGVNWLCVRSALVSQEQTRDTIAATMQTRLDSGDSQ